MNESDYRALPALSSTELRIFARCPADLPWHRAHPREQTPEMLIGSALHSLCFEPELFPERYIIIPDDAPRRPTALQKGAKKPSTESVQAIDWWDGWELARGQRASLTQAQADEIYFMSVAISDSELGAALLKGASYEHTITWEDRGIDCKARLDVWHEDRGLIVDLKSTRDASPHGFNREIWAHRYDLQLGWYARGMEATGHDVRDIVLLAAEKREPYSAHISGHRITMIDAEAVSQQIDGLLSRYAECVRTGIWPGYSVDIHNVGARIHSRI